MIDRTVPVAFDQELHTRAPLTPREEIVWAYLDTAYNLLREASVRLVIQEMRDSAAEQGIPFPATDQEVFDEATAQGEEFGVEPPRKYLDLAPQADAVATALDLGLQVLLREVREEAEEAAQFLATSDDVADLPEVEL